MEEFRKRAKRYKRATQTRDIWRHRVRIAAVNRRADVQLLLSVASCQEGVE